MTTSALLEIVNVAALCALGVGVLGLLATWITRHWSVRWHVFILVAVAVLGTYVGILAIAHLMFLSHHDLLVVTVVSSVAAVIAFLIATGIGWSLAHWSTTLQMQVRGLASGTIPPETASGPRELRAVSRELAATQRRLEQSRLRELRLEEARRELVSWVSHDLRTPLAGMRAMAEALEDDLAPDPQRFHRQIRAEVDRMTGMVDDLFELSQIHAGVLRLNPTTLPLEGIITEAVNGASSFAHVRGVRLGGQADSGLEITADPASLSRVLSNLLVNAIRHTPTGGSVQIIGRGHTDGVELCISDECGGLTSREMSRVFDLGWQGNVARTPGTAGVPQGAGLGLAIVKGIVEAHHGHVEVESSDGSNGCRFTLVMPRFGETS